MMWTDNPVRDAERYQQKLDDAPHIYCDICGETLYEGDTYYDIGGEMWCPECLKRELKRTVRFE